MAKSLVVPLACKAPTNDRFLYPNCPYASQSLSFENKPIKNLNNVLFVSHYTLASLHRRLTPVPALDSDASHPLHQGSADFRSSKSFEQWNSLTAKFSGASSIPFTLLQLPQIILNAQNLLAGNKTALLAVPWLGMFTGLLGNLSLLSYFAKKKEKEATVVQTLGVVSIYAVMWSTFVPYIPNSILPGTIACVVGVAAVVMARIGRLPEKGVKFVGAISGWTATLLFMWMPVSQMWTNFLNPDNIKGLSAVSMLLAMIGNGLMIPRALFIRDFMWFTGSTWAALFYGYGNIVCLYLFKVISREFFLASTAGLFLWIGPLFQSPCITSV
ncbi:hypothetical protein EZV62_024657 [Acer yangbiense]|uniref:Uncharacterized protein n=1 Tax=Acer yangbiense TaxID=1000413 RepID=A0A5C7GWT0_9ROSI|nr:hypothetical protein EZV62_024657 [Acer yangbiense]